MHTDTLWWVGEGKLQRRGICLVACEGDGETPRREIAAFAFLAPAGVITTPMAPLVSLHTSLIKIVRENLLRNNHHVEACDDLSE